MKCKALISIVLIFSLLLASCGFWGAMNDGNSESRADTEKHNSYIELINFATRWFDAVLLVYFNSFGDEDEPNIDVNFSDGFFFGDTDMYAMYRSITEPARRFAASEPSYGLADEKMIRLCNVLDALIKLYFYEINSYYNSQEYMRDNFEQGRLLHTRMLAYTDALHIALEDFIIAFQPIMIVRQGSDLPRFEEHGAMIRFYSLRLVLTGIEISLLFERLELEGIDFLDADLAEYEPLYDLFVSDLEALRAIYTDQRRQREEGFTSMQAQSLNLFVSHAQQMEVAATDTLNMIRAGTTEIENELTGLVTTGGRNNPVSRFNQRLTRLIGQYNNTIS